MKFTSLIILSLSCILLNANDDLFTEDNEQSIYYSVKIKPAVCMLQKEEHWCNIFVNLSYESNEFRNICIFIDDTEKLISCHRNIENLQTIIKIKAQENQIIVIRDEDSTEILSYTRLKIAVYQPAKRKRRKYSWGVL